MTPNEIVAKYNMLKSERSQVEGLWDLIEQFVMPFRGEFFRTVNTESSVDWRKRKIYDSTAVYAAQNLAAAIQSNLINPASRWFDLVLSNKKLMEDDSVREWIEECAERVYYALQESNFNREASESILDIVGFGTSIPVEEVKMEGGKFERLDFSSIPIKEAVFVESSDGGLLELYRLLQYTALQMRDKFGEDNLPDKVKELLDKPRGATDKFNIVFAIYKRNNEDYDKSAKILPPKKREYASRYIFYDDPRDVAEEGGYYEMPAFNPRWRKTSGSKWGHSPAAVALADIMSLNELVEMVLENAAKVVDPPTLVTKKGLLSTLDLGRGGMTVVSDINAIKDYVSSARFDVGALQIEDMRRSINHAFYVDQLELKDSPAMTATEAQIRYELMQRLMGPTTARMQNDWLDPCISRTFNILYREGLLPDAPEAVKSSNATLEVQYTGPMARSHKREIAMAIESYMRTLNEIGQTLPDVLDVPDPTKMGIHLGILQGVPAIVMRSMDEIKVVRDERNKKMEEQRKSDLALAEAKTQQAAGGQNGQ